MVERNYMDEDLYYALYEDLGEIFSYISFDEFGDLFKRRLQYSSLPEDLFIENDMREIEGMINEIDRLNRVPDYVPQDPNYLKAKGYVSYLKSIGPATYFGQQTDPSEYTSLHSQLVNYITISTENLRRLIEGDNIQPGTSAKWIGKAVDAYRFAYWLNPESSPKHNRFKAFFNKNITGVLVHENQRKDLIINLDGSIWDILSKFRVTAEIDNAK